MGAYASSFPSEDDGIFDGITPWPQAPEEARCWFVDANAWQPSRAELGFLLSLLPAAESAAVLVLRNPVDRKRALLSRMLQRHLREDAQLQRAQRAEEPHGSDGARHRERA